MAAYVCGSSSKTCATADDAGSSDCALKPLGAKSTVGSTWYTFTTLLQLGQEERTTRFYTPLLRFTFRAFKLTLLPG
jgi:hypothetical protein